jgi:tyrosine-protein phosphatase YwqE
MVHFISSDCHSDRVRVPMIQKAVKHLQKKCNEEQLNRTFINNPTKIIEDLYI